MDLHHQIEKERRGKRDRGIADQKPQHKRKGQVQHDEGRQYVGVDRGVLHGHDMNQRRARIFEKEPGVGFVQITAAAARDPDQHEIGDHEQHEGRVDFEAAPQAPRQDGPPALLAQRAAIGQHAGVAGYEHKDFGGVAEAVIAQRQPFERVAGDVVDEDEPERQPAADIEPQVTAIVEMNGRTLPRSLQTAVDGFDGSDLRALNILVADSAALVLPDRNVRDGVESSSPAQLSATSLEEMSQ